MTLKTGNSTLICIDVSFKKKKTDTQTAAFYILFDILTLMHQRIHFFWDMMPCQWVNDSENFGSTVCL